jgi:hypothetical protein
LASPALTGTPTAPTAAGGTNTTQIATTAFVQAAAYTDSSVDTHLNTSTASNGEVLSWTGSDYDWVAQSSGGGASVTVSETAPSSPSVGDLWFDPSVLKTFVYYNDGTANQWVQSNPTGGGASVTSSDSAPSSPSAGDLWFDTTNLKLYVYYNDGSSSQWVQTNPSGADGPTGATGPAAGRNKIINGNYDLWMRGTSFSASDYTADRWKSYYTGGTTTVCTRQSFTLGQTDVPGNPEFYSRLVVTSDSSADAAANWVQKIEDVRTFSGQTVTVSFYAKADAVKNIAIEFYQDFGSGGSPSSRVYITPQKFALSTSWTKYTKTFTIPNIAGKTLGTNNSDHLTFQFFMDAGSDYNSRTSSMGNQSGTFEFSQVQVEEGSSATAFEEEPVGHNEAKCQRYYTHALRAAGAGYATGVNQTARAITTVTFPTTMRAIPTITELDDTLDFHGNSKNPLVFHGTNSKGSRISATSDGTGSQFWAATLVLDAEL